MKNEKTISQEKEFEIIQRMIRTSENDLDNNSFYNLLWGWLVLIASLGHYALLKIGYEHPYVVWMLMPLGNVISAVYGYRHERHKKTWSYIDTLLNYVLIAFLVALIIVLSYMSVLQQSTYPMVMLFYCIWLFVQGGALRFKPLIIGGMINWACAIAGSFMAFEPQMLLLAFAMLAGYIVPGYMLNAKFTRNENTMTA